MKKLFLLFALISIAFTAMAQTQDLDPQWNVWESYYYCFYRSSHGGAVNPVTHTTYVQQDGLLEIFSAYPIAPYGDPCSVKIRNIVYGSAQEFGDYFVEGEFYAGQIRVPIPQVIQTGAKGGRNAVLTWGTVSYNAATGGTTFVVDSSADCIIYDLENDRIIIEGSSGPIVVEGPDNVSYDATGPSIIWMEEDGEDYDWAGYTEWSTELCIALDEQPEGEVKTYKRTSDCIHYIDYYNKSTSLSSPTATTSQMEDQAEIVFSNDGKTVYFKDPLQSMSYNTWILGTLNEDKTRITVPLPQCLCFAPNEYGFGFALKMGESKINQNGVFDISNDEYYNEATYLIEGNTIKLESTWADFSAEYPDNFNAFGIWAFDSYEEIGNLEANIVYTLESDTPEPTEKTADPVINGYPMNNGYSYCVEIVPSEPSTIYYRVQKDNEPFTNWTTYVNELIFNNRGIYLVEAYAKADNKLPSDYVNQEFEISQSTGVDEMTAGKQIVESRYYNVMGQEIQQPDGMTIIVTTYSDGTTTATKVMK